MRGIGNKNIQETNLKIGAYHFFSYDSDGETQAENFISNVEKIENNTEENVIVPEEEISDEQLRETTVTLYFVNSNNEIAEEAERVIRIRDGKMVEDYINPGYEEKYGRESKKNNKNPIDEG